MFKKISIIGVGLIGGSIGMAARRKRLARKIVGIGRRQGSIDKALRKGAIDIGTLNLKKGIEGADLIIIATPVDKVKEKIREAAKEADKGAIIMDVNSTKADITKFADSIMPRTVYFVGTHPIAGSEESGVLSGSPELFVGTISIITPTRRTDKEALKLIRTFWQGIGAKVEIMSAHEHDMIVAGISHLPHMLAYSLACSVSSENIKMAGSGFKDTTRVAKSNPDMWAEIFIQNKKSLLKSLDFFQKNIELLKSDIKSKKKNSLIKRLSSAKRKRDKLG